MILYSVSSIPIHDERHKNHDHYLLGGDVNLAGLDVVADILGATAVDLATDGESSTEDLKNGTLELLGEGAAAHLAGNVDDFIEGDRLGVLDVLLLLAVTRRLLQGLDDEGRGGGHNRDLSLTVLDGELDSNTETFPVTSVLGNIFTNLLGRQTERTDLRSQSGLGSDLTTSHTEVDDLHLIGVELRSYPMGKCQSPWRIYPRR
ncbi:hypothetical protein BJX61DRAFT_526488 [Aspergillus egyptiacus]|nr:hypothetical protein BJX61DRAFT_526488 [Aspergillus egyptiacus]